MPLPRVIARLNRIGLNRVTRVVALKLPGLGVVGHVGRRTGRVYETPVNVFRTPDGVRIALTYGQASDWVRNVVAAGGCTLRTHGSVLSLAAPRIVHDTTRAGTRPFERMVLGVLRVDDFLDLTVTS